MLIHHGQIIEKVIRRNGHSISDVARLTNVNRRSVYNWFNQQQLKPEIIYRIGCVINHDFSEELPQLFTSEDFQKGFRKSSFLNTSAEEPDSPLNKNLWKDKYVDLLERYNSLLLLRISVA
ncbi:helix-turn-helix domain-containing protein [Arcticibacter eurypsychrophilus]|uniref:helix-turn-helix domain-containing protein n=1 Tax=Arcticibacter eurypsychrophilus TaxID=1434752 RepID=UPI00084DA305|nr:helix-turn-helix domain-containing protein [Arcticibacter eurypsychrophilus]